jgi:hypothetical protein
MFDNMMWEVTSAIRMERLAQARRNLLLNEAEQASTGERTRRHFVSREVLARRLVALAARLAPGVPMPRTGTEVLGR